MKRLAIFAFGLLTGFAVLDALKANGLVVLIIMAIGAWYWTLRRGLLTVRAFMYLGLLTQELSPMQANDRVFQIGYFDASSYAPAAKSFVREYFRGKQLPMIAEARNRGFVG